MQCIAMQTPGGAAAVGTSCRPNYKQNTKPIASAQRQVIICDLDIDTAALCTVAVWVRPVLSVYCVVHGVALSTLVICAVA